LCNKHKGLASGGVSVPVRQFFVDLGVVARSDFSCRKSRPNAKPRTDKWNLEQITKKAREIGADGIIIMGKAGTLGVGIPIGTLNYVVTEEYGMTAVAIKYK
jgi:hypothetical protein